MSRYFFELLVSIAFTSNDLASSAVIPLFYSVSTFYTIISLVDLLAYDERISFFTNNN